MPLVFLCPRISLPKNSMTKRKPRTSKMNFLNKKNSLRLKRKTSLSKTPFRPKMKATMMPKRTKSP